MCCDPSSGWWGWGRGGRVPLGEQNGASFPFMVTSTVNYLAGVVGQEEVPAIHNYHFLFFFG